MGPQVDPAQPYQRRQQPARAIAAILRTGWEQGPQREARAQPADRVGGVGRWIALAGRVDERRGWPGRSTIDLTIQTLSHASAAPAIRAAARTTRPRGGQPAPTRTTTGPTTAIRPSVVTARAAVSSHGRAELIRDPERVGVESPRVVRCHQYGQAGEQGQRTHATAASSRSRRASPARGVWTVGSSARAFISACTCGPPAAVVADHVDRCRRPDGAQPDQQPCPRREGVPPGRVFRPGGGGHRHAAGPRGGLRSRDGLHRTRLGPGQGSRPGGSVTVVDGVVVIVLVRGSGGRSGATRSRRDAGRRPEGERRQSHCQSAHRPVCAPPRGAPHPHRVMHRLARRRAW